MYRTPNIVANMISKDYAKAADAIAVPCTHTVTVAACLTSMHARAATCQAGAAMQFSTEQQLAEFLGSIRPYYREYAAALWALGVGTAMELANGSVWRIDGSRHHKPRAR
jgi:hypothetical protein